MTPSTTAELVRFFTMHGFGAFSRTTAAVAIALLVVVAAEREVLRARDTRITRRDLAAFSVIILPTALIFGSIVLARFLRLS
jgi:hypothetical protein